MSFMKALEPSRRAPSAPGPKTKRPSARSRSASPSTSGCSGPTTTSSASTWSAGASVTEIAKPSGVRPGMPGLPGVTTTSAVRPRARASACSRPPLPTTQTFTGADPSCGEPDELLAARADADQLDGHADLLGEEGHVLAGGRREVVQRCRPRQIRAPTRQLLEHRRHLVQHGLVVGGKRVALAVGLVGDADLDRVEGVEHVELGECHLGQGVEADRLAQHDGVEPTGAAAPAGVGAVLVAAVDEDVTGLVEGLGGERPGADAGDIRLGDADDGVDLAGPDPGPGTGATGYRVGGGDEGIGAVVEVEEGGLGPLEEHVGAGGEGVVDEAHRVTDH